jgi:single-stranded-DNA-specific exonuclease
VGRAEKRRQEIQRIFEEIDCRPRDKTVVFEGAASWTLSCLGPVASKICQKYNLPTFLFKKMANISRGAVRVPPGVDAVKAMNSCSELLQTYGGHAPAAGFTVKNKNINKFKKCLTEYFRPRL